MGIEELSGEIRSGGMSPDHKLVALVHERLEELCGDGGVALVVKRVKIDRLSLAIHKDAAVGVVHVPGPELPAIARLTLSEIARQRVVGSNIHRCGRGIGGSEHQDGAQEERFEMTPH